MLRRKMADRTLLYPLALTLIVLLAILNLILFPAHPVAHWMIGGVTLLGIGLLIVEEIALRSELKFANAQIESLKAEQNQLAVRDPLTELLTPQTFKTRLSFEIARARRYNPPLTVMLFELSDYPAFLRTHGRVRTQEMIRQWAAILNETLRTSDIVGYQPDARYLLAMPNTERLMALRAAERLSDRLAAFNVDQGLSLTASIGLSEFHGEDPDAFILITEARLDQARKQGPNQIVAD